MRIHGDAPRSGKRPAEYYAWMNMRRRCTDPKSKKFELYGARGIAVCERWLESYENFLGDMGRKPSPKHSLDRIDNNGPYSPENCRWASMMTQANNTRNNRIIESEGVSMSVSEWGRVTGLKPRTISTRLRLGWRPEIAVQTPARIGNYRKPKEATA